jgi:YebC/PmpR family DNA-binding regulatory protein
VAVIAECLVCNVNRTAPEIRTIFDKNGGNLGVPGSVSYSFAQQGSIIVDGEKAGEERLMEVALEAGAQDIRDLGGAWQVLTAPADLSKVKESLESASIALESAEIAWIPGMMVQVDPASGAAVQKLIDALEEHDDVQKVFTNAEFAE